jgi:hypothetical protein
MFSHGKQICQCVIRRCNLHSDISLPNWWKQVHKFVSQAINRLRNDRNTAMKWATLGKILWQRSKQYGRNAKLLTKPWTLFSRLVPYLRQNIYLWEKENNQTSLRNERYIRG